MGEQSIAQSGFSSPSCFSNPGLGMPPATSLPVRLRRHDEGGELSRAEANDPRARWHDAFRAVRAETERRAAPLSAEDQLVQSMADASPTKWHRAHTTWFFEQFLLVPHLPGYRIFDEQFAYLFNSYYVAAGPRHARPRRGFITRPDCERVAAFGAHVDVGVERLLESAEDSQLPEVLRVLEIGLNHEQQHQELLLTDILHAFAQNPLAPAYAADWCPPPMPRSCELVALPAGIHRIGFEGAGYSFDNEGPPHAVLLQPASRDQCAMARLHGRPRLRDAIVMAFRRLGNGRGRRLERARLSEEARWSVARVDARRAQAGRSGRGGCPCQLLRGGRLRTLGG